MTTGIVKFFKTDKGYGFIRPDDSDQDVFVHVRDMQRAGIQYLVEGMRVGFDLETNPRNGKAKAARLRVI